MPNRTAQAADIVRHYSMWSAGAGLIPVPVADLAAITGVQVKMVSELAKHYGVAFEKHKAKTVITGVLGSVAAYSLAYGLPGSLIKAIPLVGSLLGAVSTPIFASAVTYGLGTALIAHFEAGGDLDNLNPADPAVQRAYEEGFRQGREEAVVPATGRGAKSTAAATA